MRDLINKGITDADIDTAARIAWGQGWTQLKMYFMIGLPTETEADVLGIAHTGIRVWELARALKRHGAKVTVSASALIPKPHSTFQWEPMQPAAALRAKQRLILDAVRPHRSIKFKYHDVDEGVVECILSRGDRRLGRVIEMAWRRGARFDAWSDHFDYERWMGCLRDAGLDPDLFLRRIPIHAPLPWDHIDSRVTKKFLIEDLHRGMKGRFSPACEKPFIPRDPSKPVKPLEHAVLVCYDCGLECDLEAIKHERIAQRDSLQADGAALAAAARDTTAPAPRRPPVRLEVRPATPGNGPGTNAFEAASGRRHGELPAAAPAGRDLAPEVYQPERPAAVLERPRRFYRVQYAKRGDLRWLSHLDLVRTLQRGFKRAGIVLSYSRGFHPVPLMSFGPALAVGIESECELLDFEAAAALDGVEAAARLNAALPGGLHVHRVQALEAGEPSLAQRVNLAEYRAWVNEARRGLLPEEFAALDPVRMLDPEAQRRAAAALLERDSLPVRRTAKGATKEIDIRPFVRAIDWLPESGEVRLLLRLGPQGQARPREVLEALYGVPGTCFRLRRQALFMEREPAAVLEPALV
jgi:radical SAM-linked protein